MRTMLRGDCRSPNQEFNFRHRYQPKISGAKIFGHGSISNLTCDGKQDAKNCFPRITWRFWNDKLTKSERYQNSPREVIVSGNEVADDGRNHLDECSLLDAIFTYIGYGMLVLVGYIKEFFLPCALNEKYRQGYAPLYSSFEGFYTRNVYRRARDGWNVPICSVPGQCVTILDRFSPDYGWTFQYGKRIECINTASYNYLGFAENQGPCASSATEAVTKYGATTASTRRELGNTSYHNDLDTLVARFVGHEDALTCAMGFAANALNLPSILDKNCLVISDEMNHASIILGLKTSGATVQIFKHNNPQSLEKCLREAVITGKPSGKRWEKIFIIVEGVYSMEGSIVCLPEIIKLKKKYKAYLYVDEAHSIGALGTRGRGVCDYWGVDPLDVDILMGTFTKSFGSAGGYVAGPRSFIQMLRRTSFAHAYGGAMPAPLALQIISSMTVILGEDGSNEGMRRVTQVAENSRYFRHKLRELGFTVYGSNDSPVVPVAVSVPSKIIYFVREMRKRGVAIVGVGFPATSLVKGRVRFCISAAHTKEMLDHVLQAFAEIGDEIGARTSSIK